LKLFAWISNRFHLHYGYQRFLRSDYLPTTETKIKKSIFGSVKVDVPKIEDSWLFNPSKVTLEGAIKGIYPINFWNDKVSGNLTDIGFYLPSNHIVKAGVVAFSDVECLEIYKKNSKYVEYIHFSDTD